jgi:uncharacterized protein YkwD
MQATHGGFRVMTRFRMAVVGALLACLILPASPAAGSSAEVQMVRKVNAYRAQHGLPRVRIARSLMRSSERYAWQQMRNGYFGHSGRIRANSSKYRRLGEILEWHRGRRAAISRAFRAWLNSGGHRAIIMDRGFRYAGAGLATGRFRGRNAGIWVMHFGSK